MDLIEPLGDERVKIKCPKCGVETSIAVHAIRLLRVSNPQDMMNLLGGELDALACPASGTPLAYRPVTALVGFGHALVADGSATTAAEALPLHQDLVSGLEVEEVLDTSALRAALGRLLRRRLTVFEDIFRADDPAPVIARRWREITPDALTGFEFAAIGVVPHVGFAFAVREEDGTMAEDPTPYDDDDNREAIATQLGDLQARALMELLGAVLRDDEPLQPALDRHVQRGLILPMTAAQFDTLAERATEADDWNAVERYVVLAVHAAICDALGAENRFATQWAQEFVLFSLAQARAEDPERLRWLALSPDRTRRWLTFQALWDITVRALTDDPALSDDLATILTNAGFPTVMPQVMMRATVPRVDADATPSDLTGQLDRVWELGEHSVELLVLWTGRILVAMAPHGDVDALLAVHRHALDLTSGDDETRADLLQKLGEALKLAGQPERFLDLVGDRPRPWELELEPTTRAHLWNERSNALRLLRRTAEALQILDEIATFADALTDSDRGTLEMNQAILLRESGEPDRALAMFLDLVPRVPEGQRLSVLESLIVTMLALGHFEPAKIAIANARTLASGPWAARMATLDAAFAAVSAAEGDDDAAAEALARIDDSQPFDVSVRVPTTAALARLANASSPHADAERLQRLIADLQARLDDVRAAGHRLAYFNMLYVLSEAATAVDDPARALEYLERAVNEQDDLAAAEPPLLVRLARHRWAAGRVDDGRRLLRAVPAAMAARVGGVMDLAVANTAHGDMASTLREIGTTMLTSRDERHADLRLLAELQRDGAARARAVRLGVTAAALAEGVDDDVVATLAPDRGTLYVIEWFETTRGLYGLLTSVTASGEVDTDVLTPPDLALNAVVDRLRTRLDGWTPLRPGSPLDYEPWQRLEDWLRTVLTGAGENDHVVIIDHSGHAGLPWHAVSAPWSVSYASGWNVLLDRAASPTAPSRIGVLSVPAIDDDPLVEEAFAASLQRTRALGSTRKLAVTTVTGPDGDAAGLRTLLTGNDIVKLMCHGFVAPQGLQVGLMLAAEGRLPAQHAIAAASPQMAEHRFNWRDAQAVEQAPPIVLSAACSSGVGHFSGLGQRLSLYVAWRARGTRAVIAPAWDGGAVDVLEILDATLERYLDGGVTLAAALRDACTAAEERMPRWRARALSLDGDWR